MTLQELYNQLDKIPGRDLNAEIFIGSSRCIVKSIEQVDEEGKKVVLIGIRQPPPPKEPPVPIAPIKSTQPVKPVPTKK